MTEKTDKEKEAGETNWTCVECGTPKLLASGTRYYRCDACGSLFRLKWRGARLESQATRALKADVVDERMATEVLKERALRSILVLRELNNRIRDLEMSKGGERITLFAVFAMICAFIYFYVLGTLQTLETVWNSVWVHVLVGQLALFSLAALFARWLHRRRFTLKVVRLQREKETAESELESSEAALALRGEEVPTVPLGRFEKEPEEEEQEKDNADIISRYAIKQRMRRKRLTLRQKGRDIR